MKKYIIYFCFATILIPICVYFIVKLTIFTDSQWIGFFGNLFGAILGGIISGCITLFVMKEAFLENKKDLECTFKENNKQEECKNNREYAFKLIKEVGRFKGIISQFNFLLDKYIEEEYSIESYKELVFSYHNLIEINFELTSILYIKEIDDEQVYELDEYKIEIEKIIKDIASLLFEGGLDPVQFKQKNINMARDVNIRLAMIENLTLKIAEKYYKNDIKI